MTDKTSVRKTKYFKAYGSKLPTHKIFVLQCTLKTAYKKLMIKISYKTSEVIVITGNCVMITHFEENKVKKLAETNACNAIHVWT